MNFRPAVYKGKPVLTWWEGNTARGLGRGDHVIVDQSYRELERFGSGRGLQSDLHELTITRRGTALITSWDSSTRDLTSLGGTSRHEVIGGVVQEIEIPSARVVFEWRSLDHVAIDESYQGVGPSFDYFHINSVDIDDDGDLIVSARNTWAIYKIDRGSGKVVWRLGGKKSDFDMGPGAQFAWQHDARHIGPGTRLLSLFNNAAGPPATEKRSHAMVLALDHRRMRARRVRNYFHYRKNVLSFAMGNAHRLGNGNVLVGWGTEPYFTEFTKAGAIAWDARLPPGGQNYRILRFPWVGRPDDLPKLVARSTTAGRRLYVSWNGATEVAAWQLHAGARAAALEPAGIGRKRSFETMLTAPKGARFAQVAALDARGKVLALTNVVAV